MSQGWRSGSYRMLIGGKLVEASSGATMSVIDPATEEEIARVPEADDADAKAAVDAAQDAFPSWRATPLVERAAAVSRLADAIAENKAELGSLESFDTGSCIGPMTNDIGTGITRLRYFAGLARELKGVTVPASDRGFHFTVREPYGVVVGITAFNHPFLFATAKIAPPLVAGNTVVLKPPPQAPLTSLALAEIAADILPPGVLNIVSGQAASARRWSPTGGCGASVSPAACRRGKR